MDRTNPLEVVRGLMFQLGVLEQELEHFTPVENLVYSNEVFLHQIVVELFVPDEWQFVVLAQKATFMVNNRTSWVYHHYPEWKMEVLDGDTDKLLAKWFGVCFMSNSSKSVITFYDSCEYTENDYVE